MPVSPAKLQALLADRWARLNSLYYIKPKAGGAILFKPNKYQAELYQGMHHRNLVLKARQLGFTTFIDVFGLDMALFNGGINVGIVAHRREDATAIFEEKIRFAYDRLPQEIRARTKGRIDRAGELRFANGSSIRVSSSFRSGTYQILHGSEVAKLAAQFPGKAKELNTGSKEAVPKDGIIFYESTAEGGQGLFYETWRQAWDYMQSGKKLHPLAWKHWFFPWFREPEYSLDPELVTIPQRLSAYFNKLQRNIEGLTLAPEQRAWYAAKERDLGEEMWREYPSFPQEAFAASMEGTYFAAQMRYLVQHNRIERVDPLPGHPVDTWWDLGIDDYMAIWFVQEVGSEKRMLNYVEGAGEGLPYYADLLAKLRDEHGYRYGRFVMPHDADNRSIQTGESTKAIAETLGLKPIVVSPLTPKHAQIEKARQILPLCRFDEAKCERGLARLRAYRKKWDAVNGQWLETPQHDEASHGADAFQTGAIAPTSQGEKRWNPNLPRRGE